ncbi:SsgA family sporulation/cell division regulator [Streptomyces leeuwenhoekii]|uniref:Cell division protein n=1 Tax=Streptomyces leeuwenhoekii TaxID=1437453 RepID=A0A0F7VYE5_STRLW|nr:SsgA family sporulation/cell division regulator [Streptomyces leeuwenhoekii]KMS81736.1 cell division protein [Streptomyces leeuwenhoekii]CQR63588.1 Regulatory Protein [Streptomyces leeuwenhoekii]
MSVVEQYARAHVLTDTDLPDEEDGGAVPVVLRYDPEHDPRSVCVALPGRGSRQWTFSRALLEQGLRAPAGTGEVRVWPCGRVQAVVEFHSAHGCSVVQFDTKALLRFLRRTYTAAPAAATEPVAR